MRRIGRRERLDDLKDLRHLEGAIAENAGQPLIPWEQVKAQDAVNFTPEFEELVKQTESDIAEGRVAAARQRPRTFSISPALH